ncbi:MAG: hypothetical protein LBF32_01625 [Streptococcaceae bacterium]|jgi:hypothetical protein|nr:hypothetical protein [Streptococcaceae bacterium]
MKKDKKSIEESKQKLEKNYSKKQKKEPSKDTFEINEYVIVATSLRTC